MSALEWNKSLLYTSYINCSINSDVCFSVWRSKFYGLGINAVSCNSLMLLTFCWSVGLGREYALLLAARGAKVVGEFSNNSAS